MSLPRSRLGLEKPKLTFLDFPAEIRNEIYRPYLVMQNPIMIQDIHSIEVDRSKLKTRRVRTRYQPKDHDCPCAQYENTSDSQETTTYIPDYLWRRKYSAIGLLMVSRQIRAESVSIFYGENTFLFASMSAVVPFLADRTPEALANLRSLEFYMRFDRHSLRHHPREPLHASRSQMFQQGFSSLAVFRLPKLESVVINIEGRLLDTEVLVDGKAAGWMQSLGTNIEGLKSLAVEYHHSWWDAGDAVNDAENIDSITKALWSYLAPKMLKDFKNSRNAA